MNMKMTSQDYRYPDTVVTSNDDDDDKSDYNDDDCDETIFGNYKAWVFPYVVAISVP